MKKQIMVCDDEEGIREALKLILEKDFDVIMAENGEDAVKKMKASPVDLVILDVKMPRMDGLHTLKRLKKINPSCKVIIATGYRSVEIAQAAARCGAYDYVLKPFDRKQVLETAKKNI